MAKPTMPNQHPGATDTKRRLLHRSFVAAMAIVTLSALLAVAERPTAHADPRPNIVVIEIDDMRADELQYLPKTMALLPGAHFTNSVVSASLCCPSRATFLTGQYAINHKVTDNSMGAHLNTSHTIAAQLHASGYTTSMIGKYLNGYGCAKQMPQGWDNWQALCSNIYGMYKYSIMDNGFQTYYGTNPEDYQTDVLASRASTTIENAATSGNPFFMWITPTAPHGGTGKRVAPKYATTFSKWKLPPKASFNEANVTDKPAWLQQLKPITVSQRSSITKAEAVRLGMLQSVDDLVEKTVNTLRDNNLLGNTNIIFTSDNGFMHGEHRIKSGKEVAYAESVDVPLIISGPGIQSESISAMAVNADLAPTIAGLAGVALSWAVDGRSLLPALGALDPWPQRAVLHSIIGDFTTDGGGIGKHPSGIGVTSEKFAYFEYSTGERELYDHTTDPLELSNQAGQPNYFAIENSMQEALALLKVCAGTSCQIDVTNIAPNAVASVQCDAYFTCQFDGSMSSDADGVLASWAWDFGDGYSSSEVSPIHTFETGGIQTVTFSVEDELGASASRSLIILSSANSAPVAVGAFDCVDLTCTFTSDASTDADGYLSSFRWTFGDGKSANLASASHAYTTAGTYNVALTVADNRRATDKWIGSITVTLPNAAPVATMTATCVDLLCSFDGTLSTDSDGTIDSWSWDFGDGIISSGVLAEHLYDQPGVYAASLIVYDNLGAPSLIPALLEITVQYPPIPTS